MLFWEKLMKPESYHGQWERREKDDLKRGSRGRFESVRLKGQMDESQTSGNSVSVFYRIRRFTEGRCVSQGQDGVTRRRDAH